MDYCLQWITEAFLGGTKVVISSNTVIVPFYLFSVRKDMAVKNDLVRVTKTRDLFPHKEFLQWLIHYLPEKQENKLSKLLESADAPIKVQYRKMGWERDLVTVFSIIDGPDEPKSNVASQDSLPGEDDPLPFAALPTGGTSSLTASTNTAGSATGDGDKEKERDATYDVSKKIARNKEKGAPRLVLTSLGLFPHFSYIHYPKT